MKRVLVVFLMFVTFMANAGADLDMRNQILDNEIERLTMQRDEKYAALQKCEKNTKGFKIAGITTLVATGIGVYGNIKLSEKLKGKSVGKVGGVLIDNRTTEQKVDSLCIGACNKDPDGAMCKGLKAKGKC